MFKIGVVLWVSLFISEASFAFQLGEHEWVLNQAYQEFVACFPEYKTTLNAQWLLEGDLDEDLNLFAKELKYSHFYNPHKKLNMWREDSSGRIHDLNPQLLQCRQDRATLTYDEHVALGQALHHFQDMAVPAHVVPVNHSFWDGFENLKITGSIESEWTCAQMSAGVPEMQSILKDTAEQTLGAIQAWRVEVVTGSTRTSTQVSGTSFWRESTDGSFGNYGRWGNHFGEALFNQSGETYLVVADAYILFKREQLRLAVRATLRGMVWALKP